MYNKWNSIAKDPELFGSDLALENLWINMMISAELPCTPISGRQRMDGW